MLAFFGAPALAQPDVTWEPVADQSHDTVFLPYSVGPEGRLWAAFNEVKTINDEQVFFQGLYRLSPPFGPTTTWEKISEPVSGSPQWAYVVSQDTVLLDEGNKTHRSVDGGSTWDRIQTLGRVLRVIEMPRGLPYAGRLIAARGGSMASFSDDRGATWTRADQSLNDAEAERIAIVTTGPHAGRLVAGGLSGITVSDDGGFTWQTTSEWASSQQSTDCIATLYGQAPDGGDRLVTVLNDLRIPDDSVRVSISDDGGDTWRRGQGLFPGDFRTCMEVVDLGDGRAVAVMMRGPVWWTEDAGETWTRWAEWSDLVSAEASQGSDPRAFWAFAGPDGRLYIGFSTPSGDQSIHDKRTSEVVAPTMVAREPEAEAGAFQLRVAPNPSQRLVTLELAGAARRSQPLVVVDGVGREVARTELTTGLSWRVDVSSWAPGVYHARVEGDRQLGGVAFTVVR